MTEQWRSVVGFEGLYEVSDLGRVRSATSKQYKTPSSQGTGYLCVWLYSAPNPVKNKLVSRLVLEAFRGPAPSSTHQAAHGDGCKSNNTLSNLRWATPVENHQDKLRHGTHTIRRGEDVGLSILTCGDIERIRDLRALQCTHKQISQWMRTCLSNVAYILQRRTWKHVP